MTAKNQESVYRTVREASVALASCPWREGDVVLHRGGHGRLIEAPYVVQATGDEEQHWDESMGWTIRVGVCRLPYPGAVHTTGQPSSVTVATLRRPAGPTED